MSKEEREDIAAYAQSVDVERFESHDLMISMKGVDFQELSDAVLCKISDEDLLERLGKKKCEGYWRGREER